MKNTLLYIITVAIWGSTWLAIEFQLGEVAIEVSLFYRFGLAALIMLALAKLMRLSLKFSLKQHGYMALLGLLNFSLNYALLYEAQKHLSSAISSIVFSVLLLMNIVNTRLFFGKAIPFKTYLGALIGLVGITSLFWPQVMNYEATQATLLGLVLGLSGTLMASFGNMVSVRNSNNDYPILSTSAVAMAYGSLFLLVYVFATGAKFTFSSQPSYWISLGYLSLFGTVIAFYAYFVLLKNIGTEKTSYSIVLFPLVAVTLSSIFEGFSWTPYTLAGFILIGLGNLVILIPQKKLTNVINQSIKTADLT